MGAAQLPLDLPWKLLRLALKPPCILLHIVSTPLRSHQFPRSQAPSFSSPHFGSPDSFQPCSPSPRLPLSKPASIEFRLPTLARAKQDAIAAIHVHRTLDFREPPEEGCEYFTPPGSPGSLCSLRQEQRSRHSQEADREVTLCGLAAATHPQALACCGCSPGQLQQTEAGVAAVLEG